MGVVLPSLAAVAALGIGGIAWGSVANADLGGGERDRVAAAATRAAGGTAVEVETSDDVGAAYEVEVRRADGTEVDVSLDKNLHVVSQHVDREDADEHSDGRDDSRDDDAPDAGDRALSASERTAAENAARNAANGGTVTKVEAGDDLGVAYEVEVRKADGTELDLSLDKNLHVVSRDVDAPDGDERALTASQRSSAEKAALASVKGGTVTEVEAGDDPGEAYEVEILDTANQKWDLVLDSHFTVIRTTADD
jgi:uncharacterized membrane protein YkoI